MADCPAYYHTNRKGNCVPTKDRPHRYGGDRAQWGRPHGSLNGFGADAPVDTSQVIQLDSNGVVVFTPAAAAQIMQYLKGFSVIFLDNDNDNAKLDTRTTGDVRQSASDWVTAHLTAGKSVIAGSNAGAVAISSSMPEVEKYVSAVSGTAAEKVATAGITPLGAVLARPVPSSLSTLFAKLGTVGTIAVGLLAVGGIVMLSKKKRHP